MKIIRISSLIGIQEYGKVDHRPIDLLCGGKKEMTLSEAIIHRHSVRQYEKRPIEEDLVSLLQNQIETCNQEGNLSFQLVLNEPKAFQGFLPHYGGFKNVQNYIALAGPDDDELDEKCGYFGERLVLFSESIGLSTCWVGGTFNKRAANLKMTSGDRLCLIISIGYAALEGKPHRSKDESHFYPQSPDNPEWFVRGIHSAMLAPSAMNLQRFHFIYNKDDTVSASSGSGPFAKVDLGIAKLHFEIGSGRDHSVWAD